MKMRDTQGFVLQNAAVTAESSTASIDGCTGVMMLGVSINGEKPRDITYPGEKSTPVISN